MFPPPNPPTTYTTPRKTAAATSLRGVVMSATRLHARDGDVTVAEAAPARGDAGTAGVGDALGFGAHAATIANATANLNAEKTLGS